MVDRELPKYMCHKTVHALKIERVEILVETGEVEITPEDDGYAAFNVAPEWFDRYHGDVHDRGYFVRYADGYTSWSPTEVFEQGYTRDDG